jgi:L-iditol 2-dehydrogenase
MKAVKLYSALNLRIEEIIIPEIHEDEALIRVKAVGICRSDCHYYHHGKIGDITPKEPLILGHEFSGIIEKTGKNIRKFKPGDRVAVEPALSCGACEYCLEGNPNLCPDVKFASTPPNNGALAEYFIAKEEQLFSLPDEISFDEGAILEPLGVAIHSYNLAKIKINQNIAVLGTGSIGLLLLQLIKASLPKKILCTDILDNRLNIAKKIGADITLNPKVNPLEYNEIINSNLNKFDIIFEASGNSDVFKDAAKMVKPGGKLVIIGIFEHDIICLDSNQLRRKGINVKFVRRMKHTYPNAIDLVLNKKINAECIKTHNFTLEDTLKAFDIVDNYKDNVIKAIINP